MSLFSLAERIVLVTGASGGIGGGIARCLSRLGARVLMHYHKNAAGVKELRDEIVREGGCVDLVQADITDEAGVKSMFASIKARHGRLDGLVNNAGILTRGFLSMMSLDTFRRSIDINLLGNFMVLKAASLLMIESKAGAIVNVSSAAGFQGLRGQGAYSATKAALNNLTIIAAKELANYNIRVNGVAPGYIDSGMMDKRTEHDQAYLKRIPLKRIGSSDDVAASVAFLLSDLSSYITGQTLIIDGGLLVGL
jgi:3-oxoacyl-[acyl-carrier protein] reductase